MLFSLSDESTGWIWREEMSYHDVEGSKSSQATAVLYSNKAS